MINDFEFQSLKLKNDNNKNDRTCSSSSSSIHCYSNNELLVTQQKILFDILWGKAIPAKFKIKQMEKRLERYFGTIN